ncbi:GNAT family N-acetyltransferase [Rhodobacteraceae bacterium CYK-10]|uniref:GNAT family N-acetyltransferase n=2 Tax=Stagnihabitans tardus TaxID=2699202 RepID=A0AAE4Y9N4_9RHOB|nr:GNAT family N-acetyltransferase [Stagnihabitans tardus]NBZ88546.1 GNAT family N-acetyltransferase [Stagnihabitans tardus]
MARLHAACFTLPPPWSAQELAATQEGRFSFTLERPGGFLMAQVVAGEAELLTLAVDPGARRQGIGRALVAGFLAEARARGAESAFLEVAEGNAPARALYEGQGFAETGRRRGYYRGEGRQEDAILMGCSLA